jgi:GTP-binding protein HflX
LHRSYIIAGVVGNTSGLKPSVLKKLKKLSNRRFPVSKIVNQEIARSMTELSFEMNRQLGVLVDRQGHINYLIVGDANQVFLPDLKRSRVAVARFRGLRLVHTHLSGEGLTDDDITDLVILRLDLVSVITFDNSGLPEKIYSGYINPDLNNPESYILLAPFHPSQLRDDYLDLIESLELEFGKSIKKYNKTTHIGNQAILVGLDLKSDHNPYKRSLNESLNELTELCKTAEINVNGVFTQSRAKIDTRTVIGKGKLKEIVFHSIRHGCDILIFDRELSPAQAKNLSDFSDLKIVDRTQLILDIFARHAKSQDGKLQVELAQLRYLKSRLSERDDNMSRLTGGIGGRGPGETKLEIGRRRVGDRISILEKQLKKLKNRRNINRAQREKEKIPLVAIIGYTNAGKSTLLNSMTNSSVIVENKLFATLDTITRRIRFPEERELIISDTVGFIHDLPKELIKAFEATLEELSRAKLLLQVVDASDINFPVQMESVDTILSDLQIIDLERIIVFNKIDRLNSTKLETLKNRFPDAVFISALKRQSLDILLERIQMNLFLQKSPF